MSDIRIVRTYPHPPAKVWRALTEPALIALWGMRPEGFAPSWAPASGSSRSRTPAGAGSSSARCSRTRSPSLLRYSWIGNEKSPTTYVTFRLEPHGGGTRLTFEHAGFEGVGGFFLAKLMMKPGWKKIFRLTLPAVLTTSRRSHAGGHHPPTATRERKTSMRRLMMFNNVTLDGFFTDRRGTIQWAHQRQDEEWKDFTSSNASGGGALLLGRITYQEMAAFWPTPEAHRMMPVVARGMNEMPSSCSRRPSTR